MIKRAALTVVAIVLLVTGVLVVRRHEAINWLLPRLLSLATGYDITISNQKLGTNHGALIGVHVSKSGDRVLDADRIDVWYNPRDLLPGSAHRYGINAIAIDHPRLAIVRHAGGGYNIAFPHAEAGPAGPAAPAWGNRVPINLTLRIAYGSGVLSFPEALDLNSRLIEIANINVDAGINSSGVTQYTVTGEAIETIPQPFFAKGKVDEERGFAMHHVQAKVVPLRAIANFFINSNAAHVLAGNARDFDARAYALDVQPNQPIDYHIGGSLAVSNAAMHIVGLAQPLEHIAGRLEIVDDTFYSNGLSATLAGAPVAVSGGIFQFASPQYRLGIATNADFKKLREVFAFAHDQPVSGLATVHAVIEGPLGSPVVLVDAVAPHATYRGIPLQNVHADVSFANSVVTVAPLVTNIGDSKLSMRGTLDIGDTVHSRLGLHYDGDADALPYAGELVGKEPLVADAILDGNGTTFTGYGALASARSIERAAAVFHVEPTGRVDVEPFWVNVGNGSFAAAYHLDRKADSSAFWMVANGLHLQSGKSEFPASVLPDVPAIDGVIDSFAMEGGGQSGVNALVAGDLRAHDTTIANVKLDDVRATFAGHLSDAAVDPVFARGPWGSIAGVGALSTTALAVRGTYAGTLEGLRSYLSDPTATGSARGTASLVISHSGITIQAQDVALHDATVHGLPVGSVRGTFGVNGGALEVYSGVASIAGGSIVAAGNTKRGGVGLVGHNIAGAPLRHLGLPIDAGTVAVNGSLLAASSLPQYTGGFSLAHGASGTYDVAGSGNVAMHGPSVHLDHVVGSLDGNVALVDGNINAITSGDPQYDVSANVPAGDVTRTLNMFDLPTFYSDGTYNGLLHITGSGTQPDARGPVNVPAGSINGLPYVGAHANLHANRSGVAAGRGSVTVGSTWVGFFAASNPRITGVRVDAPHAKLEDFNNFFDTGDTLGGKGSVRFNAYSQRHRITSNGGIDLKDFRYRNFAIGDTRGSWSSLHNILSGNIAVGGEQGLLKANGSIALMPSRQVLDIISSADYHVNIDLDHLEVGRWLGVLGVNVPFTGSMDGDARIDGRYPALQVNGTASLADGSIWRLPIESADLAFSTVGKRLHIDSGSLVSTGLTATATGTVGFQPHDPLALQIYLNSDNIPKLSAQLWHITPQVSGVVESTVTIGGTFDKPSFAAAFDATDAEAYGVKIPSIFGLLKWNKNSIQLQNAGVQFEKGSIALAGTLPLTLDPFGIGPSKAPVDLNLSLDSLDPGVFDTLAGANTKLSGALNGELQIAGTIGSPRIYGRFAMANGGYVSDYERTPITKLNATLTFDRAQAAIQNLSARLGEGTLTGSGHVAFANAGGATFEIDADARDAALNIPQFGSGALTGKAVLSRATDQQATLAGNITLHDATIPFAAFLAATQSDGSGGFSLPVKLGFDMDLAAGKNVRVRGGGYGAGLDIGAIGKVKLAGTLAAPTLDGGFTATNGTLTYFDRAFRVQQASVAFTPSDGIIPMLHATGTSHVAGSDPLNPYGADVTIAVDGPINGLKIAFSSNPPGYSNEQILAMIAPFGGLISSTGTSGVGSGTLKQEAFNILNAQFTAGLLAPFETALSEGLGFENVNLNVDYYGRVGFTATHLLGKVVNFVYNQTFGLYPSQSAGLQLMGRDTTSAQLTFYWSTRPQALFPLTLANSNLGRLSIGQPNGGNGFAFTLQRLYW